MKFSVSVCGPPAAPCHQSAARFVAAAINAGHEIVRVFFYQDGVLVADSSIADMRSGPQTLWSNLSNNQDIELMICVGSAIRRGLIADADQQDTGGIHPAFEIAGLGQLADAIIHSDRHLTFGT